MSYTGACLCEQTKLDIKSDTNEQILCHCTDCRKSSGSAFGTVILVPQKDVSISGPTKNFDMKVPSGNTVTRIFCSNCGSPVSHKTPAFGDKQAIHTGVLPDFAKKKVGVEIFTKDRFTGLSPVKDAGQVEGMPAL